MSGWRLDVAKTTTQHADLGMATGFTTTWHTTEAAALAAQRDHIASYGGQRTPHPSVVWWDAEMDHMPTPATQAPEIAQKEPAA